MNGMAYPMSVRIAVTTGKDLGPASRAFARDAGRIFDLGGSFRRDISVILFMLICAQDGIHPSIRMPRCLPGRIRTCDLMDPNHPR